MEEVFTEDPDIEEETEDSIADDLEVIEPQGQSIRLPFHLKCASHTLSLICTTDTGKTNEAV